MSKILLFGTAVLDMIASVDRFPQEDEEKRMEDLYIQAGGNAANTAQILGNSGHQTYLCAPFSKDAYSGTLKRLLESHHVNLKYSVQKRGSTPLSHIIISRDTGSRTILHHRDLPEIVTSDIKNIPFQEFDWIHFEGRNISVFAETIKTAKRQLYDQIISVEMEKPRPDCDQLFPYADIIFLSRAFALKKGYRTPVEALTSIRPYAPQALLTCTWSAEGAWLLPPRKKNTHDCIHAQPLAISEVIDTLGAGDTFNAGMIDALLKGLPPDLALKHATQLASLKTERQGLL